MFRRLVAALSPLIEELIDGNQGESTAVSAHELVITDSVQPCSSTIHEQCVNSAQDFSSLGKAKLATIHKELDSSMEIIEGENETKKINEVTEDSNEEIPKGKSSDGEKQEQEILDNDAQALDSLKKPDQPPHSEGENGEEVVPKEGHKPKGQYADLVKEMCEAIMPMLENIATTLSAPDTGLIPRVNSLQAFCEKVDGTVYTKKSGLVARKDRFENALNNGLTAITNELKSMAPLMEKINPIDEQLKEVENFIPEESLVANVNLLEEKVTQLQTTNPAVTPEAGLNASIPLSNDEVRANKCKCEELSEKMDMNSNYLEVLFKDVAAMKKQVVINSAKRMVNELVVGGICCEEEEDCIEVTKCFLMNKMTLMFTSENLIKANRSNNSTEKKINNRMVHILPVMFIKVTDRLCKQILSNSWQLANMKDDIDGFGYYVKQSMPEPNRAV